MADDADHPLRMHDAEALPHVAEIWDTAHVTKISPDVHAQYYELVALIVGATSEEVQTWPPVDHMITLEEIVDASWGPAGPEACGTVRG
jgi:hypothetical protein